MPLIYKIIVLSLLLLILISLGSALFSMAKGDTSGKMLKSLTWRIGLSVFLFILLIIGQATGVITSHGL
ncbi:MAG: twin transmembrane helix small protein [Gammaproteobacteria bacterium]|nr:twin transmembrane helix small protein [Gammaproteobacteria bacterium]MDX2486648.1 twin transmembrane helix small protein [Gammaproteobacteria bacterium]